MHDDPLGQRRAGRHQKGRPEDRVKTRDVLTDHMGVGRPEFLPLPLPREPSGRGDVVRQRVDPDVADVMGARLRARRDRNAPVEGRPRDREILEPALHEGDHLVLIVFRGHEARIGLVMGQKLLAIGREPKEPALLLYPFDRRAGGRKFFVVAFGKLAFVEIGLVAHRIPAGVFGEVNVAVGLHAPPDVEHGLLVAGLRRAHDVVGAGVQDLAHMLELRGGAVGEGLRREPLLLGRALHFLAVLVHAGDEQHVEAVEPLPAREGVGGDALIGVADVRRAIGVGNGGRDHIGRARHGAGLSRFCGAGKRREGCRHAGGRTPPLSGGVRADRLQKKQAQNPSRPRIVARTQHSRTFCEPR